MGYRALGWDVQFHLGPWYSQDPGSPADISMSLFGTQNRPSSPIAGQNKLSSAWVHPRIVYTYPAIPSRYAIWIAVVCRREPQKPRRRKDANKRTDTHTPIGLRQRKLVDMGWWETLTAAPVREQSYVKAVLREAHDIAEYVGYRRWQEGACAEEQVRAVEAKQACVHELRHYQTDKQLACSFAENDERKTDMFVGWRSEERRLSVRIGCRCPRRGGGALVVEWTCECIQQRSFPRDRREGGLTYRLRTPAGRGRSSSCGKRQPYDKPQGNKP